MRGKILSSDLCGILRRISTKQTLNYNNVGTTFLKYFFQAFWIIIWNDHNKRMSEWEEIRGIPKCDYKRGKANQRKQPQRQNTRTTPPLPDRQRLTDDKVDRHKEARDRCKQLLTVYINTGFVGEWGFVKFGKGQLLL